MAEPKFPTSFWLTGTLRDEIAAFGQATGASHSDIVRWALVDFFQARRQAVRQPVTLDHPASGKTPKRRQSSAQAA